MKPMREHEFLSLAAHGCGEAARDFLRSHGFEDAARLVANEFAYLVSQLNNIRLEQSFREDRELTATLQVKRLKELCASDSCTLDAVRKALEAA